MKFISLFFLSLLPLLPFAQVAGKITFEEKIDMHRNIPEENQDFKNMIPQFNTSKWELSFTTDESVFKPFIETELTGTNANQPWYMMRWGSRENRVVYKNLPDDKIIDSREFMQKQFLIKGFLSTRKWKIGKKQKTIGGYNCLEASCIIDSTTAVTAWFAPQINIANGPADYQGLPGMILQIDINDGERTMTATHIQLEGADTSMILAPTKGKSVTAEEFEEIRKEKMKEMNLQQSGSGRPVMIMRHN